MFTIKNFGNDESFKCIDDLKDTLYQKYKGKHVSVVYPTASGILRTLFVSVDDDGTVRESYGENAVVDFNQIKFSA